MVMIIIVFVLARHRAISDFGSDSILYVTPTSKTACQGAPCLTLSQYAEDQDIYFHENRALHFLPGVHVLMEQITIERQANITSFELVGSTVNQSTIVSSGQAAIQLIHIQSIKIKSLHFCGSNNLIVRNSTTLLSHNLHLTSTDGQGFIFVNIKNITATNTAILDTVNVSSVGTISWSNGIFTNTSVLNNSGDSVLTIEQSNIQFKEVTLFLQNKANKGSSLKVEASSVSFHGSIKFSSNSCKNKGGSMNIVNSNVSIADTIVISSNNAGEGGAIQLDHSFLQLQGLIEIKNNSATQLTGLRPKLGGAINSIGSTIIMEGTVAVSINRIVAQFTMVLGGAISLQKSRLIMSGIIDFQSNYAKAFLSYGGAMVLSNSTLVATSVHLTFKNNSAFIGGAIALTNQLNTARIVQLNTLVAQGVCIFDSNEANLSAGALFGDGTLNLHFNGNTTFTNNKGAQVSQIAISQISRAYIQFSGYTEIINSYSNAETVFLQNNVRAVFNGTNKLINNTSSHGVFTTLDQASFIFLGRSYFQNNYGATILRRTSTPTLTTPSAIIGEAEFTDSESGIVLLSSEITLEGQIRCQRIKRGKGCINLVKSNLTINGTVIMNENTATVGPAITSFQSHVHLTGYSHQFSENTAELDGGSVYAQASIIYIDIDNCTFASNMANRGGALYAINSQIYLTGHHKFTNNKAVEGGAIALGVFSVLHFNDLEMIYENNVAQRGAVFYVANIFSSVDCMDDSALAVVGSSSVRSNCFYSIPKDCSVIQSGNLVSDVGNVLYGGNLRKCNREDADIDFMNLFHIKSSVQNITSDPYEFTFCNKAKRARYMKSKTIDTVPGKLFVITAAALDQYSNLVKSAVRVEISTVSNYTARLGPFDNKQLISNNCTELKYRIFSRASNINLTIYAEGPCNKLGTASRTVLVNLGSCPNGFQLLGDECTCTSELRKYAPICNVDNETIQKFNDVDFWAAGLYENGSYKGVVSFQHCPFDYCKKGKVEFTLYDPDKQCDNNRSGIICGQCRFNYSLTFGEGKCLTCTRDPYNTFGLILLFALLGIFIVVTLTLLKITVVSGTINGLIFYANIIDASRDVFIPKVGWMRTFISWLNLDFGFTVCFYDGMDTYAYTWMQFLFPFYIWMLIGIVIVISRYSVWMTKRVGSDPIAVLATLILLSYTKLLRTIITVFYFATLSLPNAKFSTVWLYDGSIRFLQGKHLALFVFALLFLIFIFFPYNILLMVGPWLQRLSGERYKDSKSKALVRKALLGWCEDYRLKMFLDAYTIPYNERYPFWTGVLLMLRCVLLLVFASNPSRNPSIIILAVAAVTLIVAFLSRAFTGRIYKSWYIDVLEATFLLNLGILSVATFHTTLSGGNQQTLANISVGISLILSLGIVGYHAFKQVQSSSTCKAIHRKLRKITSTSCKSENVQKLSLLSDGSEELGPLKTYISVPSNTDT